MRGAYAYRSLVGTPIESDRASREERFAARMGCKRLLERQLKTGAHWINDPAQLRSAMEEAGLVG